MGPDEFSRRAFLATVAKVFGVAAVGVSWSDIAGAAHEAQIAAQNPVVSSTTFLTVAEAADVDAISAQIIPSDATPGAREAGVVFFIDRALASFFSHLAPDFRARLAEFQTACRTRYPDAASFTALSPERQIEFLRAVDQTPFFDRVRLLTLLGMFSMPAYGGNLRGAGWTLIGFEDRHIFEPPFGYYDHDYHGFVMDALKPS